MGQHIVELLPNGGQIALFIATPGAANIQPRIDGAKDTLKSHPNIKYDVVATGAAVPAELTVINSWATGALDRQGHVRGRRGQHPGRRPDDPEAGPEGQGLGRRRL